MGRNVEYLGHINILVIDQDTVIQMIWPDCHDKTYAKSCTGSLELLLNRKPDADGILAYTHARLVGKVDVVFCRQV